MALSIEQDDKDNTAAVITLKGELILGPDCTRLHHIIHSAIEAGRRHLVFDVSGVAQLDSTGIGQFIDAYSSLEKIGGQMTLAGASGVVRDAFRVTRLDTIFHFVPAVADAL
jgi:anti-sigma B factor antagonist